MSTLIVAARVVNIVTYIPVAVATYASIPIISNIGPKIKPGPTPQNAAANAPTKLITFSLTRFSVVALRSPSTNTYPASSLALNSFLTITSAQITYEMQTTYRETKMPQSWPVQRTVPMIESSPGPFRRVMIVRRAINDQL